MVPACFVLFCFFYLRGKGFASPQIHNLFYASYSYLVQLGNAEPTNAASVVASASPPSPSLSPSSPPGASAMAAAAAASSSAPLTTMQKLGVSVRPVHRSWACGDVERWLDSLSFRLWFEIGKKGFAYIYGDKIKILLTRVYTVN